MLKNCTNSCGSRLIPWNFSVSSSLYTRIIPVFPLVVSDDSLRNKAWWRFSSVGSNSWHCEYRNNKKHSKKRSISRFMWKTPLADCETRKVQQSCGFWASDISAVHPVLWYNYKRQSSKDTRKTGGKSCEINMWICEDVTFGHLPWCLCWLWGR